MRLGIIIFLCLFLFFGQNVAAGDSDNGITRIELKVSDRVRYDSRFFNNPPRLVIKFTSPGIFTRLTEDSRITSRGVKRIEMVYYPYIPDGSQTKRIKFLTFWLEEGASYRIWSQGNRIYADFKNPSLDKNLAVLTETKGAPGPYTGKMNQSDLLLAALFFLSVYYIMRYRPEGWGRFTAKWIASQVLITPSAQHEKRRWWRHNLTLLKGKDIYVNIESPATNTKLSFVPVDLGYGGLSLKCNTRKKLEGMLNIKLFVPYMKLPVELKGKVAWQRNIWGFMTRLVGVSFVEFPEKEWDGIHRYIERRFADIPSRP